MHWGGDAENTDSAMAATLRAGLSFGLSGFSFWSHDIGGFVKRTPEDLYTRWLPFGMLTSHSRCHGAPPKEPWSYGPGFTDLFRRCVELKYRLMPYILEQAGECSESGWPMLRALFFEYPGDPGSWLVDDEYLFGRDLLVGPLFDASRLRRMYLPPGRWIDYQTRRAYEGPGWHMIEAGAIPAVILARRGASIPHVAPAQSTRFIDWRTVRPVTFGG
jgi:alpha-D-xyloside xylohydrolase